METIKIGKRYILRNGVITDKLQKSNCGTKYIFEAKTNEGDMQTVYSWKENGRFLTDSKDNSKDIVKEFLVEILEDFTEETEVIPLLGGREDNPTWEEYLSEIKNEYIPHFEVMKEKIEKENLIGSTGQEMNDVGFLFSDGKGICFSWRGWGDFMQAIIGKREGYMAYYM